MKGIVTCVVDLVTCAKEDVEGYVYPSVCVSVSLSACSSNHRGRDDGGGVHFLYRCTHSHRLLV